MPEYTISWTMELDALTLMESAKKALEIMQDPDSIATCFQVMEKGVKIADVDLLEGLVTLQDQQEVSYLKKGGMGCPHCGNDMAEDYKCDLCEKTWTDIYTLTGVDIHD